MVPYITVPLGDQKSGWLSKHVSKMSDPIESFAIVKAVRILFDWY